MTLSVEVCGEFATVTTCPGCHFKAGISEIAQIIKYFQALPVFSQEQHYTLIAWIDLCKAAERQMRLCREVRILEQSIHEKISCC